jgi:hypothetical protein
MPTYTSDGIPGAPFTEENGFLKQFCVPLLLDGQNADGGWGYRHGAQSSVEATSWALLALLKLQKIAQVAQASTSGLDWLRKAQLSDGSWPQFAGLPRGCWATAPASLALFAHRRASDQVARGLQWLCDTWPAEGGFIWRLRERFSNRGIVVRQDSSLRGWSWTPGTASWVEPTSYSLIALRHISEELLPSAAAKRIRVAEKMLHDRACSQGGWNGGNPLIYGVAGIPRVGPTALALMALLGRADRSNIDQSVEWLANFYSQIQGPASLSLAHLCLAAYGRSVPALEPALTALSVNNHFFGDTLTTAWAVIALGPEPEWLRNSDGGNVAA